MEKSSEAEISPTSQESQYSPEDIIKITALQRRWRSGTERRKNRRLFMLSPEAMLVEHTQLLLTQVLGSLSRRGQVPYRGLLASQGAILSMKLETVSTTMRTLQERTMNCIADVEIAEGVDQLVDELLTSNREADDCIRLATSMMSDERIKELLARKDIQRVRRYLKDVEGCIAKATQSVDASEQTMLKMGQASK